jgi:hypothetical protein
MGIKQNRKNEIILYYIFRTFFIGKMEEKDIDISILCKALEKSIKMVRGHEETIKELQEKTSKLEKLIETLSVRIDCITIDVGADEDLNDFMQHAKDEPGHDTPLDNAEIQRRTKDFYDRKYKNNT